ncbi:hypothetical protein J5N97_025839 [Dioscorea zingiberensis]|uniref:AB hydrolase-1 domain-containing protein n=1 Tax=Dioscorea zingiberensis TaxID=325984 RepID=A0A9D5C111_9LILI|nr:hypothetical protein J5N97_025839 [Dioscorea zingiberensis]
MASLQQHFVLVHGAGHGAWCWFKLRHLLQDAGHKVSCFDLTGAGINLTDPNTLVSFHDYNQPLSHFMSCLPPNHKVVLVGHSAGGLSLTQALHEFADKISVVIFLAAAMLPFGFLTEEDMNDVVENLSGYGDVFQMYYGMGPNNPPTSLKLKEEFQRELFYHMSPTEDSLLASMLLRPYPSMVFKTAKFLGGAALLREEVLPEFVAEGEVDAGELQESVAVQELGAGRRGSTSADAAVVAGVDVDIAAARLDVNVAAGANVEVDVAQDSAAAGVDVAQGQCCCGLHLWWWRGTEGGARPGQCCWGGGRQVWRIRPPVARRQCVGGNGRRQSGEPLAAGW